MNNLRGVKERWEKPPIIKHHQLIGPLFIGLLKWWVKEERKKISIHSWSTWNDDAVLMMRKGKWTVQGDCPMCVSSWWPIYLSSSAWKEYIWSIMYQFHWWEDENTPNMNGYVWAMRYKVSVLVEFMNRNESLFTFRNSNSSGSGSWVLS